MELEKIRKLTTNLIKNEIFYWYHQLKNLSYLDIRYNFDIEEDFPVQIGRTSHLRSLKIHVTENAKLP